MRYKYLPEVNNPEDLRKLNIDELIRLSSEIRNYIIDIVSETGGHLAPSLGAVELILAVHYVFNTPKDKVIFDVGHQSYAHKIITGRKDKMRTLRQLNGISGFPSKSESEYDVFGTGHASTALSASLGMAVARDLNKEDYKIISIVGDGALTGGLSYEALNNIGQLKPDMLIIINDNRMSISPNVGGISKYLSRLMANPFMNQLRKAIYDSLKYLPKELTHLGREFGHKLEESILNLIAPGTLFEELGLRYFGTIDGNDLKILIKILNDLKDLKGPVVLHTRTKKGKGYIFAEEDSTKFHGCGAFDKLTGRINSKAESPIPTYSELFGETLVKIARKDERIVAITAAMCDGTGLIPFAKEFPDRFFDVGIAEAHAVTFAAGLANSGKIPVVAIYSTFLQRAFDQIIHDVALQNLNVKFAVDRAGLVGEDGATHHGVFDLSYLSAIPNLTIIAPRDAEMFVRSLVTAVWNINGPAAIRYPRSVVSGFIPESLPEAIPVGKSQILNYGDDIAIIAVGRFVQSALNISKILKTNYSISAMVIDPVFIKPVDMEMVKMLIDKRIPVFTIEENVKTGGFGERIGAILKEYDFDSPFKIFAIPDKFIYHGNYKELIKLIGLDEFSLVDNIVCLTTGKLKYK